MSDERVIPINRALIRSLTAILDAIKGRKWDGPEQFNAILVDRALMYKMVKVPNPPPPIYRLAVRPRFEFRMTSSPLEIQRERSEVREFRLYDRIGDHLEYREV